MPRLLVVIASVREGRAAEPVATWFVDRARQHGTFEVQVADLKTLNLPLLQEPHHPRLKKYVLDSTRQWSEMVGGADAFVFVSAEYNYSTPPALVNALDTVYHEWSYKPVGFVTYGGVSGGLRAMQMTRTMVTAFKMMPMVEAVNIPFFTQLIENGVFKGNEIHDKAVPVMLDELLRWSAAMKVLRAG
jgi:NAD(P)H-dependent FMN reductase